MHWHGVCAFKGECDAPVAVNPNRKMPYQFTPFEQVQARVRQVHALGVSRFIQASQHGGLYASHAPFLENGFQALVPERLGHEVFCLATLQDAGYPAITRIAQGAESFISSPESPHQLQHRLP